MKKFISSLVIFALFLSVGVNFTFANSYDSAIQSTIEDYFNTQQTILQNGVYQQADSLEMYFAEGSKDADFEISRLKYHIESNNVSETKIEYFNNTFNFVNVDVKGNTANVVVDLNTSIKYDFLSEVDENTTRHELRLIKNGDNWLITTDQYTDEFKNLYSSASELKKITPNLKEIHRNNVTKNLLNKGKDPKQDDVSIKIIPGDSTHSYTSTMRSNAVSYARLYTDNTGGFESTSYNNSQFKYFSYKNDCQNYVSQAIWYGFGGRSSATKDFPMSYEWWANTTSTSTTWNWTGTSYFLDMVTTNYSNNSYGLQGYATTVSNISAGDYVYVPGHVLFITKATDTNGNGVIEYKELEISAHTTNRKDKNLSLLYGTTQPSNMQFIRIVRVKWNTDMQLY